jgi:Ca-activated chloride channel homolog
VKWGFQLRYRLLSRSCVDLVFLLWLMSACVLSCAAQSELVAEARTSSSTTPVITSRVQEVNLVLSVTGHHGRFVPDLTAEDISILDNDQPPERITHFESATNVPLRIALVVDISDSVAYAFDLAQSAVVDFLKHDLRVPDMALLVEFNDQPRVFLGPTSDFQLLWRSSRKVQKGGQTAIYDAVALAAQELGKIGDVAPSRRAVIVISDGEDNSSYMSLQAAAETAQENETTVYVLRVGEFTSSEVQDAMKQLCALTGGRILGSLTEYGIPFSKIEQDLRNQYAIGYIPANTTPDGAFHRIAVRVSKKLKLNYRQGYFAR